MKKGQEIFEHNCKIFWQTKKGKAFLNHKKGRESSPFIILTRAKNALDMNRHFQTIEYIRKIAKIPKTAINIRVLKIYKTKTISRSSWYKEENYGNEF